MARGLITTVLAALLFVLPSVRFACDLQCMPAPVPAAASHCASHESVPAAPADRCGHDHRTVAFLGAATPAVFASPEDAPIALPAVVASVAVTSVRLFLTPVAREGPSISSRRPQLRI